MINTANDTPSFLHAGERPSWVAAVGLLLAALVLRVYGFWSWEIVDDEYFTITKAYDRYIGLKNPLYYGLVVAGYQLLGEAPWVARLPAVVFGVLGVPLSYLMWTPLVGRRVALTGALILLFSAWHLWFSQYARFYSAVFVFSLLAYGAFLMAIRRPHVGWLAAGVGASAVAALFHASAAMVPIAVGAGFGLMWLTSSKDWRKSHPNVGRFLALGLVLAVVAVPLVFKVASWWAGTGQTWGHSGLKTLLQYVRYVQLPLSVGALLGLVFLWFNDRRVFWFFIGAFAVPALFLVTASMAMSISPNYAFYAFPLIAILCGYGVVALVREVTPDRRWLATAAVLLLIFVPMLPSFASHYTGRGSLDFREAEQFVADNYRAGDRVLSFIPEFALPDGQPFELAPFISFERDGSVAWTEQLDAAGEGAERLWVLVSGKRAALAPGLEQWLRCRARLVWRDYARRYDFEVDGYEVYLADLASPPALASCRRR